MIHNAGNVNQMNLTDGKSITFKSNDELGLFYDRDAGTLEFEINGVK